MASHCNRSPIELELGHHRVHVHVQNKQFEQAWDQREWRVGSSSVVFGLDWASFEVFDPDFALGRGNWHLQDILVSRQELPPACEVADVEVLEKQHWLSSFEVVFAGFPGFAVQHL